MNSKKDFNVPSIIMGIIAIAIVIIFTPTQHKKDQTQQPQHSQSQELTAKNFLKFTKEGNIPETLDKVMAEMEKKKEYIIAKSLKSLSNFLRDMRKTIHKNGLPFQIKGYPRFAFFWVAKDRKIFVNLQTFPWDPQFNKCNGKNFPCITPNGTIQIKHFVYVHQTECTNNNTVCPNQLLTEILQKYIIPKMEKMYKAKTFSPF